MPGPVVVDETSQDCHYPKRTAPAVDVYDYNGYDFDAIIQSIIVAGGCVVKNILNRDEVTAVEGEVRPYLDADKDWEGGFFPKETHRCHGMVGKSPTYTMKIIGNDLYQKVAEYFLTSKYTAWNGNRRDTMVSKPQLNCTNVFSIGPGARDQELHRDDMIHHNFALEQAITPEQYKVGRDVGLGLFVAGKKTTKQNGATRFIPGSHLWALEEPPVEELAFYAELEPGDGMLMLSSCFHGGSANHTEDEERLVYGAFVTRGYLRQEENQYLANPPEKVKEYPMWMQKFVGYSISNPSVGWIDLQDPIKYLYPEMAAHVDPYSGAENTQGSAA